MQHLLEVLFHYFTSKESGAETYGLYVDIYGERAPLNITCKERFQ